MIDDDNYLEVGTLIDSKILGKRLEVVESTKKQKCKICAFYGMCNGNPDYINLRRQEVGHCLSTSRKDGKYVSFLAKETLYHISDNDRDIINDILDDINRGSEKERYGEVRKMLEDISLGRPIKQVRLSQRRPGSKFISKLLGKELMVVEHDGPGRCNHCAYKSVCIDEDRKFYPLRQTEAGHCSSKSRRDNKNVFFEETKKLYTPDKEVYKDLEDIQDSDLSIEEKKFYQLAILDAMYESKTGNQ